MVRSQPPRTNESRESRFKNLADLEAAYRRVADDPSTESCVVDVSSRTLHVQLESEVRQPPAPPNLHLDRRRDPRALVSASVLVRANEKVSEHITYDLSVGGIRLCGLPCAQVGDKVKVRLQLPRTLVRARGRLMRCGSTDGRPDFAIQFVDLEASDEDAIHEAVVEVLSQPERRSLLLMQSEQNPYWWSGWEWLDPVAPICANAMTPLAAVEYLEEHRFDVGIVGSGGRGTPDWEWFEMYPEVCWRSINHVGRLRPVATTFGLRVV